MKKPQLNKTKTIKSSSSFLVMEDEEGALTKVNQYVVQSFLGKGAFGAVYAVKDEVTKGME